MRGRIRRLDSTEILLALQMDSLKALRNAPLARGQSLGRAPDKRYDPNEHDDTRDLFQSVTHSITAYVADAPLLRALSLGLVIFDSKSGEWGGAFAVHPKVEKLTVPETAHVARIRGRARRLDSTEILFALQIDSLKALRNAPLARGRNLRRAPDERRGADEHEKSRDVVQSVTHGVSPDIAEGPRGSEREFGTWFKYYAVPGIPGIND